MGHRDIKVENILGKVEGEEGEVVVKLGDFTIAVEVDSVE